MRAGWLAGWLAGGLAGWRAGGTSFMIFIAQKKPQCGNNCLNLAKIPFWRGMVPLHPPPIRQQPDRESIPMDTDRLDIL
ncbi:hypothetical protein DPMN_166659 [Dreissena polymorpha]|uniref:Uncharacterized protein n=1 Tax=Dreissena polymorpha TaxID=45954 RepID=A0A9D4EXA3_DREPO|nr:hypothetical protein DPMN_166659 [Dreissena polymorpha]